MDRQIVYPAQIPLDTDILSGERNAMVGLSKLAAAILGTATLVNGLACAPTVPASLQVQVAAGEVYALISLDATAYGSLNADTTHQIVKQGIALDAMTLSCPAPGTPGFSINYLIEAAYQDADQIPIVLPYFNASNPSQAFAGPNNSGTSQNTVRKGLCVVQVKAGVAAATGTQTTPSADAGFAGIWVVTVANGQATITAPNIVQATNAPFISETLTQKISQATADARYATTAPFSLSGTLSPAQITANQNDYAPTGIAAANVLRISSSARWNITGLSGGVAGKIQIIHNIGTFPIVFTYQDGLSQVANRFAFNITLGGGQSMEIQYDLTSSLWRAKAMPDAPLGSIREFSGPLPGGYLAIDQNVSRTTYAALFNEIGTVWGAGDGSTTFGLFIGAGRTRVAAGTGSVAETVAAGSVNTGSSSWTVPINNTKWITGQPVTLTTTGTLPAPLATATTYYIVRVGSTSIQFATSLANAQNGTVITLTTQGTGNHTATGNLTARTLGEIGGEENHAMSITELLAHTHTQPVGAGSFSGAAGTSSFIMNGGGVTGSTGGNAAMNVMQPFSVVNVGVKYC